VKESEELKFTKKEYKRYMLSFKKYSHEIDDENFKFTLHEENTITFDTMGGAGKVRCLACGYNEDIISFVHGADESTTGVQCQFCGKFHALRNPGNKIIVCECGGKLRRDIPLFCPQCKSLNMRYAASYIT
jgi:hypothetical protein